MNIIKFFLFAIIFSVSVASMVLVPAQAASDFKLFVNNSQVLNGGSLSIPCGGITHFDIIQSSDSPVSVDLTGRNDAIMNLSGKVIHFNTAYNPGKYNPKVTSGQVTKEIQLAVDQDEEKSWPNIASLSWQLLILIIFLILFVFGGLGDVFKKLVDVMTDTVKRSKSVKIYNLELTAPDLSTTVTNAIAGVVSRLDTTLPNDIATRFLPSSLSDDIASYVHVFQFLDDLGLIPKQDSDMVSKSVTAWNTVGNYYFEHNFDKAKSAYNKAIALDYSDPTAYANLGMLYIMIHKDHDTARRYIVRSLEFAEERNVTCPAAHMGMVVLSDEEKDKEKVRLHCEIAKNIFSEALKKNRKDYWSLYGIGWCWSYEDDYKRAIQFTSLALKEKEDFYAARYNLACFYSMNNELPKSLEALQGLLTPIKHFLDICNFPNDSDFAKFRSDERFKLFYNILYEPKSKWISSHTSTY